MENSRDEECPAKRVSIVGRHVELPQILVEADLGDVGFFDEAGIVAEGKSEVLYMVLGAELHEVVGELSQFDDEPICIIGYSPSRTVFHAGSDSRCGFGEGRGHGVFATALDPRVDFSLIKVEELAAFVARNGIIRSLDCAVEGRK